MRTKQPKQQVNSVYPCVLTNADAAAIFVKSLPKKENGENSYVSEFMRVADALVINYQNGFTIYDFINLSKGYDLPIPEITRLFNLWVKKLESLNKLSAINGVYDHPVYVPK